MMTGGRNARDGAMRFVATIAIATLLGPLIAGVGLFLGMLAVQIVQSEFAISGIGPLFFLMLAGAYIVGGMIAFSAGTIVAIASLWLRTTLMLTMMATAAANIGYYLIISSSILGAKISDPFPYRALAVSLVLSAVSASICWLLFRRRFAAR